MPRRKIPQEVLDNRKLGRIWLTEWREYRRLTQEGLAKRTTEILGMPITASTISRLEASKSPYSQRQLEAFAIALHCEPGDLLKPLRGRPHTVNGSGANENAIDETKRLRERLLAAEQRAVEFQKQVDSLSATPYPAGEKQLNSLQERLERAEEQFQAMEESIRTWLVALGHARPLAARIGSLIARTARAEPLPALESNIQQSTALRTEIAVGLFLSEEVQ